ncbi:MAG TPA: ammosamide/lymphostin RiPP family protein [Kineosporiaceae bacterium]
MTDQSRQPAARPAPDPAADPAADHAADHAADPATDPATDAALEDVEFLDDIDFTLEDVESQIAPLALAWT